MNTYIGARYVPILGRRGEDTAEWDNSAPYEPLTVVTYQGNSYTSRQYVPAGIAITNTDYWVATGNYNAQVEAYRNEVAQYEQTVSGKAEQTDLNALSAKLPSTQFTSTNTVKKYVDDLLSNEANLRSQGDNSLGQQINALSQKLPSSQFSGTVKEYIDSGLQSKATSAQLSALASKLPDSAFSSTNTIKKYIDDSISHNTGAHALNDRKIVCIGDSLTYSPSAHAETYWPEWLNILYGCTTYRFAHGGTGFIATTASSTKTFIQDVEDAHASSAFNDADITDVIILGGLNDYQADIDSLYTAIVACIDRARAYFTNAVVHVGFCIKALSPLASIHENSVFQLRQMYYAAQNRGACIIENPWTWITNGTLDAGDGIHANTAGQRFIAGHIASHLCGGSTLEIKVANQSFATEFRALLTGDANNVFAMSDGHFVNVYARGMFNPNVTMPSGNVPMVNLWDGFKSGLFNTNNQLLAPLNCDTALVINGSYVAHPRVYYNGGTTINAQFLHRMDLTHGSGIFGIHLSWPQGL